MEQTTNTPNRGAEARASWIIAMSALTFTVWTTTIEPSGIVVGWGAIAIAIAGNWQMRGGGSKGLAVPTDLFLAFGLGYEMARAAQAYTPG